MIVYFSISELVVNIQVCYVQALELYELGLNRFGWTMPAPSGIRSWVNAYSRGNFFRERLVVFELFFLLIWKRGFYVRFIWSFRDLIGAQSHVIAALHLHRPPLRIKKTLLNRKVFLELLLASKLGVAMDQVWYAFFYWWLIKLRAISSASEDIFCVLFHVWIVKYAFKDAFLPH